MSHALRAAALAATLAAAAARAAEPGATWEIEATLPVAAIGGHTTYRISASDGVNSIASDLEFPLQGVLAGLQARAAAPRGDDGGRWILEGSALHTLTDASGTLKDSDWIDGPIETAPPPPDTGGVGAAHPGLDIFSTSTASLTAYVLEARVSREYEVAPALRLAPVAGLLYQSFSFVARDVNQVGYGPWAPYMTGSVSGRVLTYDVGHRAVYVGGRGEFTTRNFTGAIDAWFSPFAHSSDEDDHLLRAKRSTTEAGGRAWQARLEGRIALNAADAIVLQGSALGFSTSGTQTQTFYAGPDAGASGTIDAKLTSLRWTVLAGWTHRL